MNERVLTLYGRSHCALCEDMATALAPYLVSAGVDLQIVDIDCHSELKTRFDWDVPLLFYGEIEICRHALDTQALKDWLNQVIQQS